MVLSSKQRNRLIDILNEERQPLRCEIARRLNEEANAIKAPFREEIARIQLQIDELAKQKNEVDRKMDETLKEKKLYKFYRNNGCSDDSLHQDLVEFDAETIRLEKEILLMK